MDQKGNEKEKQYENTDIQVVEESKKTPIGSKPHPNQKQTSAAAMTISKIQDSSRPVTPNPASKGVSNTKLTPLAKSTPNKAVFPPTLNLKGERTHTQNTSTPMANRYYNKAEKILAAIKSKRQKDSQLLSNTKLKMDELDVQSFARIEKAVYNFYEMTQKKMEEKIDKLFQTSDKIAKLEEELEQVKGSVGILYQNFGPNNEQIEQDGKKAIL